MIARITTTLLLALLLVHANVAQAVDCFPLGPEFEVSDPALDYAPTAAFIHTKIVRHSGGDFTVLLLGIDVLFLFSMVNHFDLLGTPTGPIALLASGFFDMGADSSRNLVAVGIGQRPGFETYDIVAQQFDSRATPIGPDFQVSQYNLDDQRRPSVAVADDGSFLAVWDSEFQDGDQRGIYGRRVLSSGFPSGGEFRINSTIIGDQWGASLSSNSLGDVVVAWSDNELIAAQRLDATGSPVGSEFRPSIAAIGPAGAPDVAIDDTGAFTLAWQEAGASNTIYAQNFDTSGSASGPAFQLNDTPAGIGAQLAANSLGERVVVWEDAGDVFLRCFDSDGIAPGSGAQVDSLSNIGALGWNVEFLTDDRVVVVWGRTWPSESRGAYARIYQLTKCGDEVIEAAEQCDDGNATPGDGCSAACQVEPCYNCTGLPSACTYTPSVPCDDGNECTDPDFCGALASEGCVGTDLTGTTCGLATNLCVSNQCVSGMCVSDHLDCGPCKTCDPFFGQQGTCIPSAQENCFRPLDDFASLLNLKELPHIPKASFVWTWKKGPSLSPSDFGDLTTGGFLDLELYHYSQGTPEILFTATIPGGGTCGEKPCWKQTSKGFSFKSRDSGQNHPIDKIKMVAGEDGRSKIVLKAKNSNLQLPALELIIPPVSVSLTSSSGKGWSSVVTDNGIKKATDAIFKGKGH